MKSAHVVFSSIMIVLVLSACVWTAPERGRDVPVTAAPATSVPTLPPTSAPTLTAVETPDWFDPCLVGVWTMDVYALNNKLLDLTESPVLFVIAPSVMTIELREDQSFVLDGQVTLRADIPNSSDYMEINGYHQATGSYVADGRIMRVLTDQYIVDYGELRAYINGQEAAAPFDMRPPSEGMFSLPNDAAYTCSANSLEIKYNSPSGKVVIESWSR